MKQDFVKVCVTSQLPLDKRGLKHTKKKKHTYTHTGVSDVPSALAVVLAVAKAESEINSSHCYPVRERRTILSTFHLVRS